MSLPNLHFVSRTLKQQRKPKFNMSISIFKNSKMVQNCFLWKKKRQQYFQTRKLLWLLINNKNRFHLFMSLVFGNENEIVLFFWSSRSFEIHLIDTTVIATFKQSRALREHFSLCCSNINIFVKLKRKQNTLLQV
jgi:hypothetical protein